MPEDRNIPQDGPLSNFSPVSKEESKCSSQGGPDVVLSEQPASENIPKPDVLPDGGYGWVCVVCVALVNAHTWGINSVCVPGLYLNNVTPD